VTWQHMKTFLWLRWRLLANQWRRAGALNAVLMTVVAVSTVVTAVPLFFGCVALGLYLIPTAQPVHLMYAWDGLIAAFLLFWCVGLLIELQRTEPLALSRFLHLPVSPNGAFLINYLSSLLRLTLIVFAPVMLGFAVALVVAKGIALLPVLPLLAAFLLMVTALTYQFQGWLASLMSNPRRRRTVVVTATMLFVLVFQLPNLLNFIGPWGVHRQGERAAAAKKEVEKLDRALASNEIGVAENLLRKKEVWDNYQRTFEKENRDITRQMEQATWIANAVLPVGWLPLGVMTAAEGRFLPSILGLAGMTLIGAVSLRGAYRTTVGQYQGQPSNRRGRALQAVAKPTPARAPKTGAGLLEARLPGVSEPVSAVALAGLRSLVRAPEAKMMLLSPVITAVVFGSMLWNGRHTMPQPMRPLIAIGAMVFVLMGMLQLMGNQFGFDRDGFRIFVLSAASRRDILAGKNLAFAPLVLGIGVVELAAVQLICPMRVEHFLAMPPLFISMYLLFCVFANLMSIFAPVFLAAGSLKASKPKLTTGLLQFVMFIVLFPLSQAPALLPLGVEAGLSLWGYAEGLPICLLLSLAECAAIVVLYRLALKLQGGWLHAREQAILDVVTNRAP
jgi:ABC-2 type transport system permease protein